MKTVSCAELNAMTFPENEYLCCAIDLVRQLLPRGQSPIEKSFLRAWIHLLETSGKRKEILRACLAIEPQRSIEGYRIDFAFPVVRLAVELDGHDFHKTKEQRTNDATRDRQLLSSGWLVLRFTGSEINRDVSSVVAELERFIIDRCVQLKVF